jgi:hypothetical protein
MTVLTKASSNFTDRSSCSCEKLVAEAGDSSETQGGGEGVLLLGRYQATVSED